MKGILLIMNRFKPCFIVVFVFCSSIALLRAANAQATPAAPAAVAPAATSAESPEILQFQKLENAWSEAINQRDQYALELALSPLFVDVSAVGDITTRNQQLAALLNNEDKALHLDQKVITVRLLGDIAVANGTYVLHHKVNTTIVDEKGVFTHVYERTRGGWLCINSQRTVLREDSNVKQKKQSTAEMPFHIPLFSKSDKSQ
jgi:ketosteroid isomerase-like protein